MIGAALLAKKAVERGPDPQAVGQDHAGAGLEGGQRLLRPRGPDAVPGQARLQPGRLRLHHLHRQLRPADPRGQRGGQRGRPGRRRGAVGQPELRGPDQPRRQDELPGLAAAGGRLRAGRHDGHRPVHRAAGHRPGRRPGVPARHLAEPRRGRGGRRRCDRPRRCSSPTTPTSSPATSAGSRCPPRRASTFTWDAGLHLRPQAPVLRRHAARAVAGHRHRRRPGAGQGGRLGDHRPHQPGRFDPGGLARRQVPGRARRGAQGLQLLRLAARQPRGDDPGHLRQHPAAQPDRRRAPKAASPATSARPATRPTPRSPPSTTPR